MKFFEFYEKVSVWNFPDFFYEVQQHEGSCKNSLKSGNQAELFWKNPYFGFFEQKSPPLQKVKFFKFYAKLNHNIFLIFCMK